MNSLDIISVIVLLIFAVLGFKRGFICELLSIVLIILGFFVVYCIHPTVCSTLDRVVRMNYELSRIIFLLLFIFVIFLVNLILGRSIDTLGSIETKKIVINLLGAMLGFMRGIVYMGIALWLTVSIVSESRLAEMVYQGRVTSPILEVIKTSYVTLNRFISQNGIDPFREQGLLDKRMDQLEEGIDLIKNSADSLKDGLNSVRDKLPD